MALKFKVTPPNLSTLRHLFITLLLIYLSALLMLYIYQRELLFHPDTIYASPQQSGFNAAEEITLTTQDGLEIISWHAPASNGHKTIIYFHGNAGGISGRSHIYKQFAQAGFGVLALEYRGYSNNDGNPTEEGLYQDARASIDYLLSTGGISEDSIILMGRSLGTGVALKIATEYETDSVFLISPYDSISDLAQSKYPIFPVTKLIKDKFDSKSHAASVTEPTYIFHGTHDNLIPISRGKTLFNALKGNNKHFIALEGQDHHNISYQIVLDWLAKR